MTRETLIRTICLALALLNQVLAIWGISPLPISDDTVELLVSTAATVILAVWSWWKNNSFTHAAIVADELMHEMKSGRAAACRGDGDVE